MMHRDVVMQAGYVLVVGIIGNEIAAFPKTQFRSS